MKKKFWNPLAGLFLLVAVALTACKDDDDDPNTPDPEPNKTEYNLGPQDVLGVTGKVTLTEQSSTETLIEIQLTNAPVGIHPAHIHANSALETGGIVISLNPVDSTGKSSTIVTKKDDNTPVTYQDLINFDGYVNVHESAINLLTIIASGDIGGNVLTGTSKSYTLSAVNSSGVNGTALFEQRKNNNTKVTINLTGTLAGATHPAEIRLGSVATIGGGPVAITLNGVDGTTGKSFTNIRQLDNSTNITYNQLLQYDGYLNVNESILNPTTIVSQGNIGSNAP